MTVIYILRFATLHFFLKQSRSFGAQQLCVILLRHPEKYCLLPHKDCFFCARFLRFQYQLFAQPELWNKISNVLHFYHSWCYFQAIYTSTKGWFSCLLHWRKDFSLTDLRQRQGSESKFFFIWKNVSRVVVNFFFFHFYGCWVNISTSHRSLLQNRWKVWLYSFFVQILLRFELWASFKLHGCSFRLWCCQLCWARLFLFLGL